MSAVTKVTYVYTDRKHNVYGEGDVLDSYIRPSNMQSSIPRYVSCCQYQTHWYTSQGRHSTMLIPLKA